MCAAEVNREFGLDDAIAETIVKAAKEVSDCLDDCFCFLSV